MAHQHKQLSNDPVERGHETSDADAKSVFISGLSLSIGLMVFGLLFSWGTYKVFKGRTSAPGAPAMTFVMPDSSSLPPLPRVQADPHVALVPFVKSQDSILASYGWVNKDSGIARIPIERAMELVVKRRLPVQEKASISKPGKLSKEELGSFLDTFETESNNAELTESNNELLFEHLRLRPRLTLEAMKSLTKQKQALILAELKSPIHDGINVRDIKEKVQQVKGLSEITQAVVASLQVAIDKSEKK